MSGDPLHSGARTASRSLRIVITADPYIPVPPITYGGIERVVDALARGLVERGHRVTLLAHPDSQVSGVTLKGYGRPPHFTRAARIRELAQASAQLLEAARAGVDVVHSFGRLAALLLLLPNRRIAKLQSYQRDRVPWGSVRLAQVLGGRTLRFSGCSAAVYGASGGRTPKAGHWVTVFNAVETSRYRPAASVSTDAPLVFLGRLERIKGAHHAILIARSSGRRLVIAGNRVESSDARDFFEREIAPHIDGEWVQWIGPVDDAQKGAVLRCAAALLMPIEWDEPFGIVMAEAMACGTPVIAFRRGSVPEVVVDGVNGFTCLTVREAVAAVGRLHEIDRRAVRADCETRFGADRIVEQYVAIYKDILMDCLVSG